MRRTIFLHGRGISLKLRQSWMQTRWLQQRSSRFIPVYHPPTSAWVQGLPNATTRPRQQHPQLRTSCPAEPGSSTSDRAMSARVWLSRSRATPSRNLVYHRIGDDELVMAHGLRHCPTSFEVAALPHGLIMTVCPTSTSSCHHQPAALLASGRQTQRRSRSVPSQWSRNLLSCSHDQGA